MDLSISSRCNLDTSDVLHGFVVSSVSPLGSIGSAQPQMLGVTPFLKSERFLTTFCVCHTKLSTMSGSVEAEAIVL